MSSDETPSDEIRSARSAPASPNARAVVFDLDGTLADTLADIASAMNHVLREAGLPEHAETTYRGFVGWGARRLVELALPAAQNAEADRFLAAFRAYYFAHLVEKSRPYPGIEALLETLVARDVPLGVLSNKPDPATVSLVERMFGEVPFRVVRGHREGTPRKPDPASAREVVAALGEPADACLFVGDTDVDIQTARAAGLVPVGVAWGFRTPTHLRDAGAQHVLGHPEELLALLA